MPKLPRRSALPQNVSRSPVTGVYRFRKVVPVELREAVGKTEIKSSLKTTDLKVATILAMKREHEAQLLFNKARVSLGLDHKIGSPSMGPYGPMSDHKAALEAQEWLATVTQGYTSEDKADHVDYILDKHAVHYNDGTVEYPTLTKTDSFRIAALQGKLSTKLMPTWSDACEAYYTYNSKRKKRGERADGNHKKTVDRLQADMITALGADLPLDQIGRAQVRKFIEFLERKPSARGVGKLLSAGTINRSIQIARAIYAHCNREMGLKLDLTIFEDLLIDDGIPDVERRHPFSDKEFSQYLEMLDTINTEAGCIARILAYTGARGNEVCGLAREDVFIEHGDVYLDEEVPYIYLRVNSIRRLKTANSSRKVPIVDEKALAGLKAALRGTSSIVATKKGKDTDPVFHGAEPLFPRYAVANGADNLSAVVNKAIKKHITDDPKVTVYSARHRLVDKLKSVGCPEDVRDAMLGHNKGQASGVYGSKHGLEVLAGWLKAALQP